MRFIHTSDWHLGKNLEGKPRIEEQEKFCDDFVNVVNENKIDVVIIAGDIYDSYNPSAQAEELFYKTVSRLSDNGQRCVLIITGDNDNHQRLGALKPLVYKQGIVIFESILSSTNKAKFKGFEIIEAKEGCTKIKIDNEEAVIITLPYPSEQKLNEVIIDRKSDDIQPTYSDRVGHIFRNLEENFEENTINIAISHMVVDGGETTDSERPIQLGGRLSVGKKDLPISAQYIALGHLHNSQEISTRLNAYYSGSPFQYGKDEMYLKKGAYIVDIEARKKPNIQKIYFENHKQIEVFKCNSIEEAIKICEENKDRDIWSYFEIKTEKVISQSDIQKMKAILKDIIEIKPIIKSQYSEENIDIKEKSMATLFNEFYTFSKVSEPKGELMDLFIDIISEEGDIQYEAN